MSSFFDDGRDERLSASPPVAIACLENSRPLWRRLALLRLSFSSPVPHTSCPCLEIGTDFTGTNSLSWVARLKIALGAAQGLAFLHQRNKPAYNQFKTSLILVDKDFNARLSDFAFGSYNFQIDAYYAAPEWFRYQADSFDGRPPWLPEDGFLPWLPKDGFAVKSEIYAFGVVLLEMLTGMNVYDRTRNLVAWATPLLADEVNFGRIIDPQLQHTDYPPKGAFKLTQLVSNCLQPKQDKRPSMEEILQVLNECYEEEIKSV